MQESGTSTQIKPMRVSVALCTYKPGRYLEEQLESIARQTVRPDEIIVTDDSPPNGSLEFITRVLERVGIPFRTVGNPDRLGVVANFEKAISQCTGDLIFLSDQDDVWVSTKVEETLGFFSSHPECLLAHSDGWITNEHLEPTGTLFDVFMIGERERYEVAHGRASAAFHRGNRCTGAACAFRRVLFNSARPFPIGVVLHDEWLAVCAAAANRIGIIDSKLIQYRQHASNAVGAIYDRPNYIRDAVRRVREHGTFHQANIARCEIFLLAAIRMRSFTSDHTNETFAKRRFEFAQFRAKLPGNPFARLPTIAGRTSDYSQLALGWQSIAADCVLGGEPRAKKA